jgi:hypothetical protein
MLLALHLGRMGSPLRSYGPGSGRAGGAYANGTAQRKDGFSSQVVLAWLSEGRGNLCYWLCTTVGWVLLSGHTGLAQ